MERGAFGTTAAAHAAGDDMRSWLKGLVTFRSDCPDDGPRFASTLFVAGRNQAPPCRSPMNVVVNALSARTGGGRTYLKNLLAYDPPEGVRVQLLTLPGLSLPRLSRRIKVVAAGGALVNPFVRAAWERELLPRTMRRTSADVLFCPGGVVGTRRSRSWRTVTMCRNMLPFDPAQRARYGVGYTRARTMLLERVLLRSMREADLIIFISEHARGVVGGRVGRSVPHVVIPHGVSELFRANGAAVRPTWLPERYLLYVSNLEPYKRQVEVVTAFGMLRRANVGPQKLVLAGAPSSVRYAQEVRNRVRALDLEDHVVLAGDIGHEALPALYQFAEVNIFASECENCPNVLLEAMASGRPLVVSNCAPMPEFAGASALYFDPGSPAQLADRLAELLADDAKQQLLSDEAVSRSESFDWETTARSTWDAILAIGESRPVGPGSHSTGEEAAHATAPAPQPRR